MSKRIITALLIVLSLFMVSCASTSRVTIDNPYPDFLADINSFDLTSQPTFYGKVFGKLKLYNAKKLVLIPRRNRVEMHYRSGANAYCIIFPQHARQTIIDSTIQFAKDWDEKNLVVQKATAKNAYGVSLVDLWFGVSGPINGAEDVPMYVNYLFVDEKPYLVLRFPTKLCKDSHDLYTPYEEIYLTREQAEKLCTIIDQSALESLVEERQEKTIYEY